MKTNRKPTAKKISYATATLLLGSIVMAPAATEKIVSRPLSFQEMVDYGLPEDTQRSSGLFTVGVGTPLYLEVQVEKGTLVSGIVWSLSNKPTGSVAELEESPLGPEVPIFSPGNREDNEVAGRKLLIPDKTGTFTVMAVLTTDTGAVTLNQDITSAIYVGVGTIAGATPEFPQCAVCHGDKAAEWAETRHATKLTREIDGLGSSHYNENCIECHTVGFDESPDAFNGGFDDVASELGWTFPETLEEGNFAAMPDALKAVSNIQCESCHGPGSEHKGDVSKISVSLSAGDCAYCHDEAPYHNKNVEWNLSKHAVATRFPTGEGREACVVCHSGVGFIQRVENDIDIVNDPDFASRITDNTWEAISCQVCHDPHDATNPHQLRKVDNVTLMNGEVITEGGVGKLCMNCHMSRRNAEEYVQEYHPHYGPHHGPQSDMLMGTNAIEYGKEIVNSTHIFALEDACATCHMQDLSSDDPALHKAGGHTFKPDWDGGTPEVADDDEDLVGLCTECHGPIDSFDFKREDFDGDGLVEGVQTEVKGLMDKLGRELPPLGDPEVAVTEEYTPEELKAAYNYLFVEEDGSFGIHNRRYAVGILRASIEDLMGSKMDPFGGVDLGDIGFSGWFESPWFGFYKITDTDWIFSESHGFLYLAPESTPEAIYVYDAIMGNWWYSTAAVYPNLYLFDGSGWVWFFDEPGNTRSFFRYSDGQTITFGR